MGNVVVYHGSDHNFKKLKISSDLVARRSTKDNEGLGIYFSSDRSVAESYGKYVYILLINSEYLWDFRKRIDCVRYLNSMIKTVKDRTRINITSLGIGYSDIIDRMVFGGQRISMLGEEIARSLELNNDWKLNVPQYRKEQVRSILKHYDKKVLKAYFFRYHIDNVGVLKAVDESVVRIINKESTGIQVVMK